MNKPVPNVETWMAFAVGLRRVGLELFGSSQIKVTEHGAADLKVLGLLLLARTLSNLKATLSLLRENQIVEARTIARNCYENQYLVLGLLKDGDEFRSEMVAHEMRHKRERMQFLFNTEIDLDESMELKIRNWLRANKQWADAKTLNQKGVAMRGAIQSYVFYQALSADSHPSVDTLNRYYVAPDIDGVPGIDIEPVVKPDEVVETLIFVCLPVIGVFLGVSELLGINETPPFIGKVAEEYRYMTEATGQRVVAD